MELPGYWAFEIITPQGLIGSTLLRFTSEGWEVNVSFPVALKPVYRVSINYSGPVAFDWGGSVDSIGVVEEDHMRIGSVILTQEDARDIIVSYLVETYVSVDAPSGWTVEDLTPGGLVGYFTQKFRGGGWTVVVGNPVVWKPVFDVEVEYNGDISFTWKGTVDHTVKLPKIFFLLHKPGEARIIKDQKLLFTILPGVAILSPLTPTEPL